MEEGEGLGSRLRRHACTYYRRAQFPRTRIGIVRKIRQLRRGFCTSVLFTLHSKSGVHAYYNLIFTVMLAEPQGNTQLATGVQGVHTVCFWKG